MNVGNQGLKAAKTPLMVLGFSSWLPGLWHMEHYKLNMLCFESWVLCPILFHCVDLRMITGPAVNRIKVCIFFDCEVLR